MAFSLVCDWTMNSWVFRQYRSCLQSQSIMHFATLTVTEHTGHNLGTVPQNYTNAELATHAM